MKKGELQKNITNVRKSLGMNGDSQRDLLRKVREAYEATNEELASALGISLAALLAYLAPEGTAKYRRMPEGDKLVLSRVLADKLKRR